MPTFGKFYKSTMYILFKVAVTGGKRLNMKRKIEKTAMIFAILTIVGICGIAYVRMRKPKKMTVEESVQLLLKYIYDEDYFPLCTKYCSEDDGPMLTAYKNIGYPVFEFDMPDSRNHTRVQVFCDGELENGEYLNIGVYIWSPTKHFASDESEQTHKRALLYSYFLVNRTTKEIIQQRDEDEEGLIYNSQYYEMTENALVYKDFYE